MRLGMMQVMEAPAKHDQANAIDLLILDHRRIEQLLKRLDSTVDPVERRSVYMQIVEQLAAHEAAEHQVIFPAFRASLEDADLTLAHRMGEHEELNELLAEMRTLAPDGLPFVKRESALSLEIEEHFRREEETVFARMRGAFDADELAQLAERALTVKQHAPAFPDEHPRIKGDEQ
jgi:hemerythrin superfamily protein